VPQVENWFNTCAGTIYRARTIFLGGGGLLFSNWRARNIEYFVMIRMAPGMQTYGARKLSPTPRSPSVIPQEVGQEWDKL
jgi:hypothetical protein